MIFVSNVAVVFRLRNEATWICLAPTQACRARVQLVVVLMMLFPWTRSGENSRGELPRSKSTLPVWAVVIRRPLRSPASKASGIFLCKATASEISRTGKIAGQRRWRVSAVVIEVVARRMSKTTQVIF